jgi:DNA-binding YbaB/EbfC family protein
MDRMGDMMKLVQQAQEMQSRLQQIQDGLETQIVSATSGGGMVTATVDGKGHVRGVKIDPAVVDPADVEMLEDLVLAAVGEAQKKAQAAAQEQMQQLTGGLQLPFKLPF